MKGLKKKVLTSLWSLAVAAFGIYYCYDAFYSLSHPLEPGDHLRMGTFGNTVLGVVFGAGGLYYLFNAVSVYFKKDTPPASR